MRSLLPPARPGAPTPASSSRSSSSLELKEIQHAADLEPLAAEWLALWRQAGASPFQSPCWQIPCARFFSEDLRVLVGRAAGLLVGLAAFSIFHDQPNGKRKLILLGTGISDHLDVLVRPGWEQPVTKAVRNWLSENAAEWDHCEFQQLPPGSPLLALGRGQPGEPCPVLRLAGRSEGDYAPPRQLEKLRYYRRRAAKQGQVEFLEATPENYEQLLHQLFELHGARWNRRGENGVLAENHLREFHREAAGRMARTGLLRLRAAMLESQVFAVFYGFASGSSTYYYLGGFDPELEKLSPGALVIGHSIEQALREQHDTFDFLRGREPYKYSWGAVDRPTWSLEWQDGKAEEEKLGAKPELSRCAG